VHIDIDELRANLAGRGITDLYDVRIVEYLLTEQRLPVEQLESFLGEAERSSVSEHAQASGLITEEEILQIRAALSGMEIVDLGQVEVEEDLARLIAPAQAVEWQALPYSRNDLGNLLVAIADPEAISIQDAIHKALPKEEIVFRLARPSEIARLIEQIHPSQAVALAEAAAEQEDQEREGEEFVVRGTDDAPIVRLVNKIIVEAAEDGASDAHIEPTKTGSQIRYRIDGVMRKVAEISRAQHLPAVARIKTMSGSMRTDITKMPQDGRIAFRQGTLELDLRVATTPTAYGEQVVMRLLDPRQAMLPLEKLGMSEGNLARYTKGISYSAGCCFITGPTGSGKSTTLYSSLARVVTPEKKLISIEDPVEYRLDGIQQIDVSQTRSSAVSENQLTFAKALRAVLRSDPDIVMVGEIRDLETAKTAIDAALTGHFLYSTLHTNDALSSITRLEQLGVERFLIAEATKVIVAQRLVRLLCRCKITHEVNETILEEAGAPPWVFKELEKRGGTIQLYQPNPDGCVRCAGRGYKGRTGVHEVILITSELKEAITNGAAHEELVRIARGQGMGSLLDDAFAKVWEGKTSIEEVERVVS